MYHCDMHDSVNQARNLILNFYQDSRTEISRIYHLERGYENMVGKLKGLGAHSNV